MTERERRGVEGGCPARVRQSPHHTPTHHKRRSGPVCGKSRQPSPSRRPAGIDKRGMAWNPVLLIHTDAKEPDVKSIVLSVFLGGLAVCVLTGASVLWALLLGLACSLWAKPGREFYASDIRESMEKGDKLAILMVHFGSAYPEARTQVLDVMNKRVKEAFPDVEVRQAYSARSVVSRLRAQGVWVQLPADALVELRAP